MRGWRAGAAVKCHQVQLDSRRLINVLVLVTDTCCAYLTVNYELRRSKIAVLRLEVIWAIFVATSPCYFMALR